LGKGAENFLVGCDCFYPEVSVQKEHAKKAIEEMNADFEFDDDEFVFIGLQGYSFWFFDTQGGDDPPVYHYIEGNDEATKKQTPSQSGYLMK